MMIYTPENVIGATLPCGARVKDAKLSPVTGLWVVAFDRVPAGQSSGVSWWFTSAGKDHQGILPDLIPPATAAGTPTQQFWREAFLLQMGQGTGRAEDWAWHADEAVRVAAERGML